MTATLDSQTAAPSRAPRPAPGPTGLPLLGNVPAVRRQGMIGLFLEGLQRYGDVVRFQLGPANLYLLAHPDHVRRVLLSHKDNYPKGAAYARLKRQLGEGLITSEGDLWRRQRRLMQPPFAARAVGRFAEVMVDVTEAMLAGWAERAATGGLLNLNDAMMRLTLSVIGQAMFSVGLGAGTNELGHAFSAMMRYMADQGSAVLAPPAWVPSPANRRYQAAMATIDGTVHRLIATRRRQLDPPADLLTNLLQARDPDSGAAMSEQQLRDEVVAVMFAGHDTTAHVLTWTWYLLARHPDVEAQLHAELARVLDGRAPTLTDLARLPYTRMILDEAMRLYSPAWAIPRQARDADEVGGYDIPAGALIFISPYVTHRHPAFWPDPERFDPARFRPEAVAARAPYAYFPFGGGPRICIGNHFALLEAQVALAMIAQRYRLCLVSARPAVPSERGTLRPTEDLLVTLQAR